MLPLLHLVLLPISPSPAAAKSCTQFSSSAVRSGVLLCTQHCAPSQPRLRLLRPRPPLPLQSPTTCRAEKARTGSHALLGSSPPHNNYRGALMRRRGGEKSALLISFSLLLPPFPPPLPHTPWRRGDDILATDLALGPPDLLATTTPDILATYFPIGLIGVTGRGRGLRVRKGTQYGYASFCRSQGRKGVFDKKTSEVIFLCYFF